MRKINQYKQNNSNKKDMNSRIVDKEIKTTIINIFHMCKKIEGSMTMKRRGV